MNLRPLGFTPTTFEAGKGLHPTANDEEGTQGREDAKTLSDVWRRLLGTGWFNAETRPFERRPIAPLRLGAFALKGPMLPVALIDGML